MTRRTPRFGRLGARGLAGLLVVWAVAWSVPTGQIAEDTKNDLYVDAWGFLTRALHLWDPQVTWGVMQNQGYGYLFPMGPFFGIVTHVVPVWVAQRLWWTCLLTAGFLGMVALVRALGVARETPAVVGALVYALSPRVLATIGGLSSEAQPVLLAPLVLLPLVLARNGTLRPRRAAAWSAVAILACGGVNATATMFAVAPAGIWLLTQHRWWSRSLTWWWAALAAAATLWWVGPLLVLGRWSPPFLDWIEQSADVMRPIGLFDVVRGTSHWLGYLVTAAGAWWPAGHDLVVRPTVVAATAIVAGVGLGGLARVDLPHRRSLAIMALVGVVLLAAPLTGATGSVLSSPTQALLDGVLSPLRNLHKADPLIRIPLAVGLAHALDRALVWWRRRQRLDQPVRWVAALGGIAILGSAVSPGLTGAIAPRGTFTDMAPQWRAVGAWLSQHAEAGRALLVPSSSFAEYDWGRTIDEPLRALTSADYAVRDAVPLTPAGTVRLLDAVEQRLQTGRSLGGAVEVLRRAGVRYLVLRNDLDEVSTGQPPVALARSALRLTPEVTLAADFGDKSVSITGEELAPVEVYDLGAADSAASLTPLAAVAVVRGGPEDLLAVADAGLAGPVVLDDDAPVDLATGDLVLTDGYRGRARWFGATRGRDASATLLRSELDGARDYRPWPSLDRYAVLRLEGLAGLAASSSVATRYTFAGLQPAHAPAAAVDADEGTTWLTAFDPHPTLTLSLPRATAIPELTVVAAQSGAGAPLPITTPTAVSVRTDGGVVRAEVAADGRTRIVPAAGPTATVEVSVLSTASGTPASVITGLAEVTIPGQPMSGVIVTPAPRTSAQASTIVLGAGLPAIDGCTRADDGMACLVQGRRSGEGAGRLSWEVAGRIGATLRAHGTLLPDDRTAAALLEVPGASVTASSVRSSALSLTPEAVLDQDGTTAWSPSPGDRQPSLSVTFDRPVTISGIQLVVGRGWADERHVLVQVRTDSTQQVAALGSSGRLDVTASNVRRLALTFLPGSEPLALASLELREVVVDGASLPAPPPTLSAPCGSGPVLRVDGRPVPTSVSGPRSALWGVGEMTWTACAPVRPGTESAHRIEVGPIEGWRPGTVVLRGAGAPVDRGTAVPVSVRQTSPASIDADLGAGPPRLLALTQNTNPGWQATMQGAALQPVVVDGFRQGFVVPEGATGRVVVTFAPDRIYRVVLFGGALVGLLALALAFLWPAGSGRPNSAPVPWATPSPTSAGPASRQATTVPGQLVVAGLLGALLAGPWAAALGVVLIGVAGRLVPRWGTWRLPVAVGLMALAGLVSAGVLLTGGGRWRGVEDLVVALAVIVALTPAIGAPRPSRAVRPGDESARRGPG